jgi:beta-galactosidase
VETSAARFGFDKGTGWLAQIEAGGRNLLAAPLRPHFWRAMTDNDLGAGLDTRLAPWKDMADRARLASWRSGSDPDGGAFVETSHMLGADAVRFDTRYRISADGALRVDVHFVPLTPDLPFMPRLGMRFSLDEALDRVEWFGNGPLESYADRRFSSLVGRYSGAIADQYHPYVRPQESGNKVGVRWMALRGSSAGSGLLVVGSPTFSGGALPYATADLDHDRNRQKHADEIVRRKRAEVHVDMRQMGLGGDDSWRSTAHPENLIFPRDYRYGFTLAPLAEAADPQAVARAIRN